MLEIDLTFKGERGDTLYNYWATGPTSNSIS